MGKRYEFLSRIKVPQVTPCFLEGPGAEAFLEEYNGIVEKDYNNNKNLKVLSLKEIKGILTILGSNTFAPILVNRIVEKHGYRVASLSDIERTLEDGDTLKLIGNYYVDLGIVLRSEYEPNSFLANNLADQLKHNRGISLKNPIYIPFSSLELIGDSDSRDYGLTYKLKENAQIMEASQLIGENDYKKFSKADEKGLPIFDKEGDRTLYTTNFGLSRLLLYGDLDLDSDNVGLAGSDEVGRVVLVSGRASVQNSKQ